MSPFFSSCSVLTYLMHYTCNIGAYDIHATLPSNIQVLYKSLQLLNRLLHRKVIALEDVVPAVVCFPPSWEFVHH